MTILSVILSFILGVLVTVIGGILHDRYKRPIPRYIFDFEEKVSFREYASNNPLSSQTRYFVNYVSVKNVGIVPLHDFSVTICFDKQKERLHYQTLGLTKNLFDLEMEYLPQGSTLDDLFLRVSMNMKGAKEVYEKRTQTGFFIPKSDMAKLKYLGQIKINVEYEWNNKKDSDVWLFDFSDSDNICFRLCSPSFSRKIIYVFKRRFM